MHRACRGLPSTHGSVALKPVLWASIGTARAQAVTYTLTVLWRTPSCPERGAGTQAFLFKGDPGSSWGALTTPSGPPKGVFRQAAPSVHPVLARGPHLLQGWAAGHTSPMCPWGFEVNRLVPTQLA